MRKVLLASTALFALGSVQAMAADISISGATEVVLDMGDSATADQSDLEIEHDIAITFSNTTDSGISMSMVYGINDAAAVDDAETTISGDFGEFRFTQAGDEHALNDVDIEGGATAEETFTRTTNAHLAAIASLGNNHVTYVLPSMIDGLYVAGSAANGTGADGEASSYAVRYSMNGITAVYGQLKQQTRTVTHAGVSASFGDIGVQFAKNTDNGTGDNSGTLIGLTYAMGDITLGYESEALENGTAAEDEKHTSIGATYAIAPGLTASLTMSESDVIDANTDTAYTSIGLTASF